MQQQTKKWERKAIGVIQHLKHQTDKRIGKINEQYKE